MPKTMTVFRSYVDTPDESNLVFYSYRLDGEADTPTTTILLSLVTGAFKSRMKAYIDRDDGYLNKLHNENMLTFIYLLKSDKSLLDRIKSEIVQSGVEYSTKALRDVVKKDSEKNGYTILNTKIWVRLASNRVPKRVKNQPKSKHVNTTQKEVDRTPYASFEAMCKHYISILNYIESPVDVIKFYSTRRYYSTTGYESLSHLKGMVESILEGIKSGKKYGKWMRWLGYVQGVMVMRGLIDVDVERDRSRAILVELDDMFDSRGNNE